MEDIKYQILLYYKYVHLADPEAEKQKQKELCERLGMKGRIIVATEGINGTVEGTVENTEKYIEEMVQDPRFANINWKKSEGTGNAFPKLKVKTRKEIVSLHLEDGAGVCDIDPNVMTGKHLKAEDLHEWIKTGKEFYIVDMRNAYEFKIGHFENSILPAMENFRDLPKVVEQIKHLKDKTVLTVCTGGVRCEKASGFLISQGFTDVYQLENGIVTYMEKYPNEDFKGKLYVFDNRVAMGPSKIVRAGFYSDDPKFTRIDDSLGGHEVIGKCDSCEAKTENYVNCANPSCHRHFMACVDCVDRDNGEVFCPQGCILSRHGRPVRQSFSDGGRVSPIEADLV